MKNFINFFFSFDKLFKEKLVVPFFWLALIVMGLAYLAEALDLLSLDPLASFIMFIGFFAEVLLVLISIRILSEVIVAIFRINDNVSPDGGKSELADFDPVAEARKAAEQAASRTREMTKSATDKSKPGSTSTKAADGGSKGTSVKVAPAPTAVKGAEPSVTDPQSMKKGSARKATPAASKAEPVKRGRGRPKGSTNKTKSTTTKKPAPIDPVTGEPVKRGRGRPKGSTNKTKSAAAKPAPKIDPETGKPIKPRRGRPKGSKNKPKAAGAGGSVTKSKPGPKPGTKVKRDADGNLLKKDGTPRKKPGPKPQDG